MLWEWKDLALVVVHSLFTKMQEKSGDMVLQETGIYQLLGVLHLPGNKYWRSMLREVKYALGELSREDYTM